MYTEKQLVRVARRENNTKRTYLVVNRLQAKHIPAVPCETLAMFDELAEMVGREYRDEPLLLIGFAETATAIGARLAVVLDSYYMQTTRESEEGVDYIYFSESHSHATEQKLIRDGLDQMAGKVRRIVFVEDEVTTGNTIMNIIRIIRERYADTFSFSVASLLNGMSDEHMEEYGREGIALHYLVKTDHGDYARRAAACAGDGIYCKKGGEDEALSCQVRALDGGLNARHLVRGSAYAAACESIWEQIRADFEKVGQKKILVLGTEEFMYPAIYVASRFQAEGAEVRCHSTTRSPIEVSREDGYPVHERYELSSMYDRGRTTFLYDIATYDWTVVLTDACGEVGEGVHTLAHALRQCGNERVRWYRC